MKQKLGKVGKIILKPLEVKILKLAGKGKSNKEIAKELNYSKNYIDKILSNFDDTRAIYYKIGVKNRAEATFWFAKHSDENGNISNVFGVIQPELDKGSLEIKAFDVESLPKFIDNIERDLEKNEQEMNGSDKYKYKEFGEWLRKQRGNHSQHWLADLLGVSVQFIAKVEKGKIRPSASNVGRIAVILKSDFNKLAEMTNWEVNDVSKIYEVTLGIQNNID